MSAPNVSSHTNGTQPPKGQPGLRFEMTLDGDVQTSGHYQEVLNPSTGEVVGYAAQAGEEDLDRAVQAAQKAFQDWRLRSNDERREACRNMANTIQAHAEELSRLLTQEQGKPLKGLGSEFEIGGCIGWLMAAADLDMPVQVLQDDEASRVELHREPIGVVGSITPWNWPLMIAIWHIAPAIRAGNTVVIKPSPYTPLSTLRMVQILAENLPDGVINVVSGGDHIGAAMSCHPGIDKIVFTGSSRAGRQIMSSAAPTLKRLTLELGGNDAGIVLPDVDPSAIAEGLFWGSFINGGQTCAALKRLYVHDSCYDAVCESLKAIAESLPMGDGLDENNVLGPVQNKAQFDKVSELVEDAKRQGARMVTGGEAAEGPGFFYPITLVADVNDGTRIVDEEQFGPVLPIIRYQNLDDAIASANGLEFGLAASVWSSDPNAARAVAARLEAGTVYINKHGEVAPHIPFGGVKQSGIGVEFGLEGLEACTNIKIYNVAK